MPGFSAIGPGSCGPSACIGTWARTRWPLRAAASARKGVVSAKGRKDSATALRQRHRLVGAGQILAQIVDADGDDRPGAHRRYHARRAAPAAGRCALRRSPAPASRAAARPRRDKAPAGRGGFGPDSGILAAGRSAPRHAASHPAHPPGPPCPAPRRREARQPGQRRAAAQHQAAAEQHGKGNLRQAPNQ